jgi:tetratricopeptide (TPR) repeat protein
VEFFVLNPGDGVELWAAGRRHALGPPRQQQVLAVLLFAAGKTVPFDTLVERVWDDTPPPSVVGTVQAYMSRLRQRLRAAGAASNALTSVRGGYRLDVPSESVDAHRFRRLLDQGYAAARGDPAGAADLLARALTLWAGEPLTWMTSAWSQGVRRDLVESHHGAVLARIDVELRLGHHDRLLGELSALAASHPLDQRVISLLMTALYRAGRHGDALEAYRQTHRRFRDELATEPARELRELHRRILLHDPSLTAPPAPVTAAAPPPSCPDTLDRDPPDFTGRDDDVSTLITAITSELAQGRGAPMRVISGMPGVGKTAFAVHVAHRLRERCPDGWLQLPLHGHDPRHAPTEPAAGLATLLAAIGVPADEVARAGSLDGLAALWRARTAQLRLVLVLDDAHDVEQISPLIPASSGTVTLVTARNRLPDLTEARPVTLDVLTEPDATALAVRLGGADRVDDPTAPRAVVELCHGLPLAIAVATGYLRSRPERRFSDLAARLARAMAESFGDDPLTGRVAAAFEVSYQSLTESARRCFRLLGLNPGVDIGVEAAAALLGGEVAEAERALDTLVGHFLVDEPVWRRFRLHDLLSGYAARVAERDLTEAERAAAVTRLLDHYVVAADRADQRLWPYRVTVPIDSVDPPTSPPAFATDKAAMAWFDAEYPSLLAVCRYAATHHRRRHTALLGNLLARAFSRYGHWPEAVETQEGSLRAWIELDDVFGQAVTRTDLAAAYWRMEDHDRAFTHAETALRLWTALDDTRGRAEAYLMLGRIHWYARRSSETMDSYRQAITLYEELGDRGRMARALSWLGVAAFEFGQHDDALTDMTRALAIAGESGDRSLQADALNNLGDMLLRLGRLDEALAHFEQAMDIARETGGRQFQAVITHNIGRVRHERGEFVAALASFRSALEVFQAVGDRRGEVETLVWVGRDYGLLSQHATAALHLRRARAIGDELNDPLLQAQVALGFGEIHSAQVEHAEALVEFQAALELAHRAGAPLEEAQASYGLGDILTLRRGRAAGREHLERALELFSGLHSTADVERVRARLRDTGIVGV